MLPAWGFVRRYQRPRRYECQAKFARGSSSSLGVQLVGLVFAKYSGKMLGFPLEDDPTCLGSKACCLGVFGGWAASFERRKGRSMTDVLNVSLREHTGTCRVRRLRRSGLTPAILYGHGEENVNLSVPTSEVEAAIRHGGKLVDLRGGVAEKALIRAIQWDAFGAYVLHLDLTRVSETERVLVSVPLDLKGEAPGAKQGGIVDHHIFDVEIECPAGEIPERLFASIKALELGGNVTVGEVELPPHVNMVTAADEVVVTCHAQGLVGEAEEEEEAAGGSSEPEIIGRKPEEGEEESH